jgi:hypothetical protein
MGEAYETEDGRSIRIGQPAVYRSVTTVVEVSGTHHYEVVSTANNGQFLTVRISVTGFDAEPVELPLTVTANGENGIERKVIQAGKNEVGGRQDVAFLVPIIDAEDVAIVWTRDGRESPAWGLPPEQTANLGAAPSFEVRSWSVPDRVQLGQDFEVSVTVANVGERDGRFLASYGVIQGSIPIDEVSFQVPAGGTVTYTTTLRPYWTEDGPDSLTVILDWGNNRYLTNGTSALKRKDVTVVRPETPTTTDTPNN